MTTVGDPTALVQSINPPTRALIGGRSVETEGGTFETLNPATGQHLADVFEGNQADVDRAVAAARYAVDEGPWSKMAPSERKRLMLRFAALIDAHSDELALMETLESGKPIADTTGIDLPDVVQTIRWHAEVADKVYDQISPSDPSVVSMIVREPIGVVAAILPWNFPLMMAGWKIGPILASGNAAILKPAEQTSMATIRLAELAIEAGIPDGVLNVVPGRGEITGQALGLHPGVDCVGFTGSTEIGRLFLRYSADSNLKRVLLECGGKSPMVVMADADDLDKVAEHACTAIFWNGGQNCSSNSRLIVHGSKKDELLDLVREKSHDWVVGDPLDQNTAIGPMIEAEHLEKVTGLIGTAHEEGAHLYMGGNRVREESGGWFVEPTIFDGVTPDMTIAREEVFGPVLAVTTFDDPEEGIGIANDTHYGLAASVFTSNVRTAHLAGRMIKAGTVSINAYAEGDITTPFGGYKLSGFGGRDKGMTAHEQYTEQKTIWLDLS